MDLLKIPLDDDECFNRIDANCNDSLGYIADQIFFFGKVIDDDLYGDETIDERKYYTLCPQCGGLTKLERKPHTGDDAICEKCGADGTYYDFRDRNNPMGCIGGQKICFVEYVKGGYVIRLFEVGLDYSDRDYSNPTKLSWYPSVNCREFGREYYINGDITLFENTDGNAPCENAENFVLTDGLDEADAYILNDCEDYCYIDDFTQMRKANTFAEAIKKSIPHKAIAALEKYGFEELLRNIVLYNIRFSDGGGICSVLGLDYNRLKADWKEPKDFSVFDLTTARELRDMGIAYSKSNVIIAQGTGIKELQKMSRYECVKFMKYIRHQSKSIGVNDTVRDYLDYKRECKTLRYDWNDPAVRYPTNLRVAHERTSLLTRSRDQMKWDIGIQKVYAENHEQIEWSDGDLIVIMPKSVQEIVQEGARQSNCVATYCERVVAGKCIIAFLRKANNPDESYYTMELLPNLRSCSVVQCRSYKNSDPSPEDRKRVNAFLQKYKAWFDTRPLSGNKFEMKVAV